MDISENGLHLIEQFEGYSYNAYWDRFGGVWTVGYGETEGVGPHTTQTRAQAEADLKNRLVREYEPSIKNLGVDLNQNQFDALCSFVWNLGPGSMQWDVGRHIREHNFQAAANAMMEYTRAGGVVLAGLVTRRAAERRLFLTPAGPPPDPHHYDWYPAETFKFRMNNGLIVAYNERATAEAYDKAFQGKDKATVNRLRPHIKMLRDRVWSVAHMGKGGPHWNDSRRLGWRWGKLNDRLRGAVKL